MFTLCSYRITVKKATKIYWEIPTPAHLRIEQGLPTASGDIRRAAGSQRLAHHDNRSRWDWLVGTEKIRHRRGPPAIDRLLIYITLSEIFCATGTLPANEGRCSMRALKAARFGYWLCQSYSGQRTAR